MTRPIVMHEAQVHAIGRHELHSMMHAVAALDLQCVTALQVTMKSRKRTNVKPVFKGNNSLKLSDMPEDDVDFKSKALARV
jgi:hypothetical protein